jgi:general secretion pathway protein A
LINSLIRITGVKTLIATIPDPDLEIMDFFNLLSDEFNMNKVFISKGDFLIEFKHFLLESFASDKNVLLIIDEAQRLNNELLEQIRMLSNIELDNRKLLNIFFVGQSEFNQLISDNRNRAFRQRISVAYQLEPLSKSETAKYIHHRMKMAGASEEIFTPDACLEVFNFSSGYPRLINVICDFVLVTGYSRGLKKIDAGLIKECAQDLKVPINTEKAPIEPQKPGRVQAMPQAQWSTPRPKQPGSFMYGATFIVLVFMIFVGYQIYGFLSGRPGQLEPGNAAPQAKYHVLEEQRQAFKTELEKEAGPNKEGAAENDVPQNGGASVAGTLASLTLEESELETVPQETETKTEIAEKGSQNNSLDMQPSTAAIDQRSIIYFEHNSNELTPEAYETLNEIVKFTSRRPDLRITVEGFTDSYGNTDYNRQLSKYRAEVVKNYLIGHGLTPINITTIGRGPDNPIESNKTSEGRKLNRRVEIQVNPIR